MTVIRCDCFDCDYNEQGICDAKEIEIKGRKCVNFMPEDLAFYEEY